MSEQEQDQPISETDLARMFDEEDSPLVSEPEPDEIEAPVEVPSEEPTPDIEPVEPDTTSGSPTTAAEYLEWAERRGLTDFEAAAKLAWEQEKFLGRKASENREQEEQIAALEAAMAETAYVDPAADTRTDEWIAGVLASPDPAYFAEQRARAGDWQTYERLMTTWEHMSGPAAVEAIHREIVGRLEEQPVDSGPPPADGGPAVQKRISDAFAAAGIFDIKSDPLNPTINKLMRELGPNHPTVQAARTGDVGAIAGLVIAARERNVTVRTLRITEDTPRPDISGDGQSPTRTPPTKNPFGEMEEEWRRMGVLPNE